ncbi:DNA alkylation repair protein [Neolewinella persica]|uniref:DNA alkylation repair protein n=1 Tax=Neolewinella persica TaxID=70998 RepID=UPI000378FEC0|nr:DNA alkylation repair protein [Neolewinella persica]
MTTNQIIDKLKKEANPEKILIKESRFGITSNNALGIYHKELKEFAKNIPKDDKIAKELFESNIYEARLLCSKIFNVENLTEKLMDQWTSTFENWEICDSFCMGLYAKSKYAIPKAIEWTKREREFEKRAGFTTIAAYCMADKESLNDTFEQFFPIIKRECTDERLYVKKSVNWALRNIGKRNIDLKSKAISLAKEILRMDNKTASWIAKNALKELTNEKVRNSDYPRTIYRKRNPAANNV